MSGPEPPQGRAPQVGAGAYQRELDAAVEIAATAAATVKTYVGRRVRIDNKAGNEPVTEADHAANQIIVERLTREFPHDVILSEEIPDDGSRLGAARVWMVDPIDGTRDFILGHTGFAVMIGLCVDGRPLVGAVCQPLTGKTYAGVVGHGAFMHIPGHDRTPLVTSTLAKPPGIRLVASKSHRTPRVDAVRKALQIEDEMNIGSVGLKIGLVAEALRDLYVYTGTRTKIWDTCGPEAILRAAGGRLTDMHGRALDYASANLMNSHGIVASNGPLHDTVIAAIAPALADEAH